MIKLRKICALFLALLLTLLVGCATSDTPSPSVESENTEGSSSAISIQLLYCSKDTLNPFHTKNKSNSELSGLMYESLVTLSEGFKAEYVIAEEISFSDKRCTVKIKDRRFSDNTAVTADDVISSYQLALESPLYSHLFYEVKSVTAIDSKTVAFELSRLDPYFENLLTFPIIKKDSDKLKNDDNIELPPIGSGKYVFSESEKALISNPYYSGEKSLDKISLVDAPDLESVQHYVEIGATDYYYTDPADGTIVRMSGKRKSVNMNNLFYLGFNHSYEPLSNQTLRQAVSSAIDRKTIVKSSFFGYATTANGFFHPDFEAVSGYGTLQENSDSKIAIENLEKIGYNNLDSDGVRTNSHGNKLAFTLLVNSSNSERLSAAELIREQLAAVGIKITVNPLSDEEYFAALSAGNFQLYLGEMRLTANMDISPLVVEGGSAAFGIKNAATEKSTEENAPPTDAAEETYTGDHADIINKYYAGQSSISEVATSLINHMPVVPIAYRSSLLFYSNNISNLSDEFLNNFFSSLRLSK